MLRVNHIIYDQFVFSEPSLSNKNPITGTTPSLKRRYFSVLDSPNCYALQITRRLTNQPMWLDFSGRAATLGRCYKTWRWLYKVVRTSARPTVKSHSLRFSFLPLNRFHIRHSFHPIIMSYHKIGVFGATGLLGQEGLLFHSSM